jgi:hypothetical protein
VSGIDPTGLESLVGMLSVSGISGNMRGSNQTAVQSAGQYAKAKIRDGVEELVNPIDNFIEKKYPHSKKMARVGESLWIDRLRTLGYIGFGMTGSPISTHGPDLVAVKYNPSNKTVTVIIGEIKALSSSRVLSALHKTTDDYLQMSLDWLCMYTSMIGDMLYSALKQAASEIAMEVTTNPTVGTYVKDALDHGRFDLYLLRARYYEDNNHEWQLRGYRLLNVGENENIASNRVKLAPENDYDQIQQIFKINRRL